MNHDCRVKIIRTMFNKMIRILTSVLLLLTQYEYVQAQSFNYKMPEESLLNKYLLNNTYKKSAGDIYVVNYLPANYDKTGKKDYTKEIQQAIDKNKRVILPNMPILINKNGLKIGSNKIIVFQPKTKIIFNGPAMGRLNDIIKIYNAKNIELINVNIKGSRYVANQEGEWSAGISILNSENITITNALIKNTWGDGIFIGSEDNGVSKNIKINNAWIDNVRRNAISITSVIGATINNVLVSNTNGTAPECGVDIEPSLFGEYIQNVSFNNFYSFNNKNAAFNINLSSFNSNEISYMPEVSININGIYDEFSYNFIGLGFNNLNWKYSPRGNVTIKNGITKNKRHDIVLDLSNVRTPIKLINEGLQKRN